MKDDNIYFIDQFYNINNVKILTHLSNTAITLAIKLVHFLPEYGN